MKTLTDHRLGKTEASATTKGTTPAAKSNTRTAQAKCLKRWHLQRKGEDHFALTE
ncbi:hypothetical protein JHK85_056215 [Glycine max]|uniref:Uncharacterized protein n=1 Tax=Glycine soja TaxID=3848 RepID=A0A0B2RY73_GLYSO|nr:hypothetical protein JHK87_055476 [Glycine soja]KAG4917934.1 hypothetical protein JHK85_056215 [Glycine max]KHN37955.1 hypothetical protein glysoja_042601 [Glycine soja]